MSTLRKTFGIVIPVYNGKKYIESAINSVLNQQDAPDQFLVFDNASTDGTTEIVQRMASKHGFQVVVSQFHYPRMVDSWNQAVQNLDTDWFHLLSADDCLRKNFVGTFKKYLNTKCAAISMISEDITEDGSLKLAKFGFGSSEVIDGKSLVQANLWTSRINVASVAVSKLTWQRLGGYPSEYQYLHDLVFWQNLAGEGGVLKVKKVVARYRVDASVEKGSPRAEALRQDFEKLVRERHPILAKTWNLVIASEPELKSRSSTRTLLVSILSFLLKIAYKTRIVRW